MKSVKDIDHYLGAHAESFAFPIMTELRKLILDSLPSVEERIKWGAPSFEHKGLMIGMVAFKQFVALWFHRGAELNDAHKLLTTTENQNKVMRKAEFRELKDIDHSKLKALILEAWEHNDKVSTKKVSRISRSKQSSELLNKALEQDELVRKQFQSLPKYKQSQFVDYINEAKRESTAQKRLYKSLEMINQGMGLNDKYRAS